MNDEEKSVAESLVELAKALTEGDGETMPKRARLTTKKAGRRRLTSKEDGRKRLTQKSREAAAAGFRVTLIGDASSVTAAFVLDDTTKWYTASTAKKKLDWVRKIVRSILNDAPYKSATIGGDPKMGPSPVKTGTTRFRVEWEITFSEEDTIYDFTGYLNDHKLVKSADQI